MTRPFFGPKYLRPSQISAKFLQGNKICANPSTADKTAGGTDLRLAYADLGFAFVANNGFWLSYFPKFMRDLESDDWAINHRFATGKMLSGNFGLSLDYSYIERFTFGSNVPGKAGFDEQVEVNTHFAF